MKRLERQERSGARRAKSPAALLVALLLGGCTSFIPDYERPAAPVADRFGFAEAADAAPERRAATDLHWREFFRDARLQRLIEIALQNNRDLRQAALAIESARAQYRIVRADELPTIGIGGTRARQPSPITGGTTNSYTVGFSMAAYELDFFGRVRSLSEAALARYLATEEARKSAQISLVAAVASTWLAVLADDELLEVTRRTLRTREESMDLTRLRYESGVASELDFRQAESLLEQARVTLEALRRQRALDHNALVLLLGQPVPEDLPKTDEPLSDRLLAEVPAGLPSEVLTRRPDVRQAELQLIAANADIGVARANLFPRITLTTSAGLASNELSGLSWDSGVWTFTAQLLQTLFDSGRNRAQVEVSQTQREIAVAQYEQAIQSGFREVSDVLAGRATLSAQSRAQQRQVRAEQRRYELADLRYRSGAASYLDVLDAQRSLFTAQQAAVQVRAAEVQNQVELYRALGGGWAADAPAVAAAPAGADRKGSAGTEVAGAQATPMPTRGKRKAPRTN